MDDGSNHIEIPPETCASQEDCGIHVGTVGSFRLEKGNDSHITQQSTAHSLLIS